MTIPTEADVFYISSMTDPAARNNRITESYDLLSAVMQTRTGACANWCTFATWASRQAGETIRQQDLRNKIEQTLGNDAIVIDMLQWIAWFAQKKGVQLPSEIIRRSALAKFVENAAVKSSVAVARGNKKVFEEIGREFARFAATCLHDMEYTDSSIQSFCNQLRDGDPPGGQLYLKRAFMHYYQSMFEANAKRAAELGFLANIEIGFHEQTRLQPEIAEALNAATIDPHALLQSIAELLSSRAGFWKRLLFTVQMLAGAGGLLNEKVNALANRISFRIRQVVTEHLMTLTIPPNKCLRLGTDLQMAFPENLMEIQFHEVQQFLLKVDKTPNSLRESGAVDWADLSERMHYIADLFRCCHDTRFYR